MNCFNIREIQSLLKRRFFTDLINTKDHRILLDRTSIGLRFKTNNLTTHNSNMLNFYIYGTEKSPKVRVFDFFSETADSNKTNIRDLPQKIYDYIREFNYIYNLCLAESNFNKYLFIKSTYTNFSLMKLNDKLKELQRKLEDQIL
jgi:hypothetical protein